MSQCIKCVARLRQSYRAPCRVRATHWLSPLWQPSSRRFRRSMGSPRPRAPPIPRRHHFPCGQGPWSTCSLNGPSTDWLQATCIWMLLQWTRTRRAGGFVGEVWQLMRRSQELRRAQDIRISIQAPATGAMGLGTRAPEGPERLVPAEPHGMIDPYRHHACRGSGRCHEALHCLDPAAQTMLHHLGLAVYSPSHRRGQCRSMLGAVKGLQSARPQPR